MHGVAIDERDVPVNESYITQIKQQAWYYRTCQIKMDELCTRTWF